MARTILIVDDDADLREQVRDILETVGYVVETAADGQAGLDKLRSVEPVAIILDMNMPTMGGIGFLRELRDSPTHPPVIVSTARANMEGFFQGLDVAAYLTKPYHANVLIETVEKCLAASEKSQEEEARAQRPDTVLLVEDDGAAGMHLQTAITAAGYAFLWARSGPEGIEKAVVEKPTVIVTKLILSGMNGDRLAETVRQLPGLEEVPVILYDDSGMGHTAQQYESRPGIFAFVNGNAAADILHAVRAAS